MRNWIIYSFYTVGTPYEKEAEWIIHSVNQHGIPNRIDAIPSEGNWRKNVNLKPRLILQTLEELKRPIVWVDCDAEFLRFPTIFDQMYKNDYDIAAHTMEIEESITSSGTVYFDYKPQVVTFIKNWVKACEQSMENGIYAGMGVQQISIEQIIFGEMFREAKNNKSLKTFDLPADYYAIEDFHDAGTLHKQQTFDVPAIMHHQASRRHREPANTQV